MAKINLRGYNEEIKPIEPQSRDCDSCGHSGNCPVPKQYGAGQCAMHDYRFWIPKTDAIKIKLLKEQKEMLAKIAKAKMINNSGELFPHFLIGNITKIPITPITKKWL